MFRGMTLAARIGGGFAAVVLIMTALGAVVFWRMHVIKQQVTVLASQTIPIVECTGQIEREISDAMYEIRGYGDTGEKQSLDAGRAHLLKARASLAAAKQLAASTSGLESFAEAMDRVSKRLDRYEQLANDTVSVNDRIAADKSRLTTIANSCIAACNAFQDSQSKQILQQIELVSQASDAAALLPAGTAVSSGPISLKSRLQAINLANAIIVSTGAIRIDNLKAQTTREMKYFDDAFNKFGPVEQKLDELQSLVKEEASIAQLENCRAAVKDYAAGLHGLVASWTSRDQINKDRRLAGHDVRSAVTEVAVRDMTAAVEKARFAAITLDRVSVGLIVGLSAAVLLSSILAVTLARSIVRPIKRIIESLKSRTSQTTNTSNQVAQMSQEMAGGASDQASSLEEVSASLEQMASMTRQNADNTGQASRMVNQAHQAAEQGNVAMTKMAQAIQEIKNSSDQTVKILKTIDEIAFQTNLLALNAAVEAARAGEAGKGFAVVAQEVRGLAQRSAEAARNTADLVEKNQKNADNGVHVSDEVGEILRQIVGSVQKVNKLIGEISTASNEQSQGIEQINLAITQMDKVTQSTAANAEHTATASEELSAQARELCDMVSTLVKIVDGKSAVSEKQGIAAHTLPEEPFPVPGAARTSLDLTDHVLHTAWDRETVSQPSVMTTENTV